MVGNIDLLPTIFDKIVEHLSHDSFTFEQRIDLVARLLSYISRSAANNARGQDRPNKDAELPALITSDRLSGGGLSRDRLVDHIRHDVRIGSDLIEIALLLIEAQIDLSLATGKEFKVDRIIFSLEGVNENENLTSWCQKVIPSALEGVSSHRPTLWSRIVRRQSEGLRILVEGLQISATMRLAVPYRIKVPDDEIDALLENQGPPAAIRLIHVSDLHLVEEITEKGRIKLSPAGVKSHAYNTTRRLGLALQELEPRYHLVAATGDLTTDGSRKAFETVLEYFQSGRMGKQNPMRISNFGLASSKARRLLIPGNHDRYGNNPIPGQDPDNSTFEDILGTPKKYPYIIGFQRPGVNGDTPLTLLFFVFDSNLLQCPDRFWIGDRLDALAKGRITEEEIKEAQNLAKSAVEKGMVKDFREKDLTFNPQKTVRIAVLHHHPIEPKELYKKEPGFLGWAGNIVTFGLKNKLTKYKNQLMTMDGAKEFVEGCFDAGIQLVLYGHQHENDYQVRELKDHPGSPKKERRNPFGTASERVHFFCCQSTLEHSESENGFHIFDFEDETKVRWERYESKREKTQSQPFELSEGPKIIELL
jgi:3',5'-cyclic AMP phosphodiesterase CpdA